MNNKAVAVAADSIVTVAVDGVPRKTYTGVNKLFEVSKGQPVAMMIYSNAEIMGLPWKTVINAYTSQSRKRVFSSVHEYAKDFFSFLDGNSKLFSEKLQREQYVLMLKSLISTIESRSNSLKTYLASNEGSGNVPDQTSLLSMAIGQIFDRVNLDEWDEPRKNLESYPAGFENVISKKYGEEIEMIIGAFIERHTLPEATVEKLNALPFLIVTKHYFPQSWPYSGIVFAGYGKGQVYPELCSYEVSNVIGGIIKRGDHIFVQLSNEEPVVIQPFAQDRMIRTLLYGIDPYLESLVVHKTFELVPRIMDQIVNAIPGLTDEQLETVLDVMRNEDFSDTINDFFGSIFQHQAVYHMVPIYSAIQALPDHELAKTAEALVNLNSFQQQVSLEIETVGGDIDVALLTPSDGFVWIKHPKHKPKEIVEKV